MNKQKVEKLVVELPVTQPLTKEGSTKTNFSNVSYGGDIASYGGESQSYGGDIHSYGGDISSYGGDISGYGGDIFH